MWMSKSGLFFDSIELQFPSLVKMVGLIGLEPMTPALSRRCSNQLSYRPNVVDSGWLIADGGEFLRHQP